MAEREAARVPCVCCGGGRGAGVGLCGYRVLEPESCFDKGCFRLWRRRRVPRGPVLLKKVAPFGVGGRGGAKLTRRAAVGGESIGSLVGTTLRAGSVVGSGIERGGDGGGGGKVGVGRVEIGRAHV